MKIENNLLAITNAMLRFKETWRYVTPDQKEEFCFIINRYLSKSYPEHAMNLNYKIQSRPEILDIWYTFMYDKPYPNNLWSKSSDKIDVDKEFSDKDIKLIMSKMMISKDDFNQLKKHHLDELKEELSYYKTLEKNKK